MNIIAIKRRNRTAVALIVVAVLFVAFAVLYKDDKTVSMVATLIAIALIVIAHGTATKPSDAPSKSKQHGILGRGKRE